jgi:hypothetical protein
MKINQIDALQRAMARTKSQYDELTRGFVPALHCCPTCLTGGRDLQLVAKLERQAMWLRVLLRRRGTYADLAAIEQLDHEYGRHILDAIERTGG